MKTPQQLLQQTLEVGACLLPDAASGGRTPYPTVFVHGLLGWGARDALYRAVPYWSFPNKRILETIHETPACVKGITIEYYIF